MSFAVLGTLAEFAYYLVLPGSAVLEGYTASMARLSRVVLDALGRDVWIVGDMLKSDRFALIVSHDCDAVEISAVLAAGFISAPISWPARVVGVCLGALWLQGVNVIRIVSLFIIGESSKIWFRRIHEEVWPLIFIAAALAFWTLGVCSATTRSRTSSAAEPT